MERPPGKIAGCTALVRIQYVTSFCEVGNMATVTVDAGICGMTSIIRASSEDGQLCSVSIESPCDAIQALGEDIKEIDGFSAAFGNFDVNPVYKAAIAHYRHAACPVPSAIIKAVEVACGLALPQDVNFQVEK